MEAQGQFYYSFKGKPQGRQAVKHQQLSEGGESEREKAMPFKLAWRADT